MLGGGRGGGVLKGTELPDELDAEFGGAWGASSARVTCVTLLLGLGRLEESDDEADASVWVGGGESERGTVTGWSRLAPHVQNHCAIRSTSDCIAGL